MLPPHSVDSSRTLYLLLLTPLVNTHVRVLYAPVLLFLPFFFLFFSFPLSLSSLHRFVDNFYFYLRIIIIIIIIRITSRKVHIKSSISILQRVEHVERDVSFSILHLYTRNYILYSKFYANDSKNEYVRIRDNRFRARYHIYIYI